MSVRLHARFKKMAAEGLVPAILLLFLEFRQALGTPSCHVGVGNGPGIIIITAPPINKTIVESSQLEGACLTNASASFDYTRLICTSFGAVAFSPNCVSDHDPPNPWCQDNVRCVNFTRLLNGSGLFSATIQASSCDITLSLSLQVSGIHPFEVELCQHICTQLALNPIRTLKPTTTVIKKPSKTVATFQSCTTLSRPGISEDMDTTLETTTAMLQKSVNENQNLSGGLIAGIVISVVAVVAAVLILLFYTCYRFNGKFKSCCQPGLNSSPFRFQAPDDENNDL